MVTGEIIIGNVIANVILIDISSIVRHAAKYALNAGPELNTAQYG